VAAAQVAGAAAAPAPAPAAPVAAEPIGLSEALDGLAPPDETAPADAPAEPATPAPEPATPAPGAAVDPLSAEALAAPGGIEKAQAFLREKQQAHDRAYLKLAKREHSLKNSIERWKTELGQSRAFAQAVHADLGLLQNGTAEQKLEALGRLSRKDGLKAWEEIAISAASGGRKAPAPEVAELRDEIRQLRAEREAERAQAHEHGQRQQLHEQKVRLVQGATDGAAYPALAAFAATKPAEVAEYLTTMIVEAHEAGRPMTWQQAYQRVNQELAPYHQSAAQPAGAAQAAGGSGPSVAQAAKPVQPTQRSPGRSLNPGLATAQGQVREMTEAERVQELASDPTFLQNLFG
jgi:hypothetical protein